MDTTVKKIVRMLSDERMDRRCAAAMIIAELRLRDNEVLEALGQCLTEENRALQLYALEALAGVHAPKVAAMLTPLLDSADEEVRAQASALLAAQGSKAVASLARELQAGPLPRRRAIVTILARNHDSDTVARLLPLLADAELGEYVLNALRSEVDHLSPEETESLRGQVAATLKEKSCLADTGGTSRALRLLGYLRLPKSVKTILGFTSDKHPVPVRLAAVAALRRPLAAASSPEATLALLSYADDPDPALARAAVDTLRGLSLSEDHTRALLQLGEARHAETRKFALEALGRSGSQKVVKGLLAHLGGGDPAARDAAAASLARLEGAGPALVGELESSVDDLERVRLLCRLIRRHQDSLKPAARQTIAGQALEAMDRELPAAEPLLELLLAVDAKAYAELLSERARAHKKAKRWTEALAIYTKLDGVGLLDDEGRYAALVSGLSVLESKKELARASRTTDPLLKMIVALLAHGEPVAAKLKKEKSLTPEDLFYIGFNFSESKDEEEKEFGAEVLSILVDAAPRSKLGRSAKNKLHLVGWD